MTGSTQRLQAITDDQLTAIVKGLPDVYNEQRSRFGLNPLVVDPIHTESATRKAHHMAVLGYFGDDEPDGTPAGRFLWEAGCCCDSTGEVIAEPSVADLTRIYSAKAFTLSGEVDYATRIWMNSPFERHMMLDNWETFGFGYSRRTDSDDIYLVCHFGGTIYDLARRTPILEVDKRITPDFQLIMRFYSDGTIQEWREGTDPSTSIWGTWSSTGDNTFSTRIGPYKSDYVYSRMVHRSGIYGWDNIDGAQFIRKLWVTRRYRDENIPLIMKILSTNYQIGAA